MLQVAEQELLTIPLSLPRGVWKGRAMQEGKGHTVDSLCLFSAGSAKPASDLQDSFNPSRSHFYWRMSYMWTFPDTLWKGNEKQVSHFKIWTGLFLPSGGLTVLETENHSKHEHNTFGKKSGWRTERGRDDQKHTGKKAKKSREGRLELSVQTHSFFLHVCDTWQDNSTTSGYLQMIFKRQLHWPKKVIIQV